MLKHHVYNSECKPGQSSESPGEIFKIQIPECHFQRFLKSGMIFVFLKVSQEVLMHRLVLGSDITLKEKSQQRTILHWINLQSATGVNRGSTPNLSYGALTHVVTVECNGCIKYHPWLFTNRDLRFPGDLEKEMRREGKCFN